MSIFTDIARLIIASPKSVQFSIQSSIPPSYGATIATAMHMGGDADRRRRVEACRELAECDSLVAAVIDRLSADIAGEVVADLPVGYDLVVATINEEMGGWVKQLLTEGDLFVHVLYDDDSGAVGCGVSVDRLSWDYRRDSTEFDQFQDGKTKFHYSDGIKEIPIQEPIVHARIKRVGRYGRPLFWSAARLAKMLGRSEGHELKRRAIGSVMQRVHQFDGQATKKQMDDYLAGIAPVKEDDLFRDIATTKTVTAIQGDGNLDKIEFFSYLLGRIDPASPVPMPLLSFDAAARVNRDTLTTMARDYRATLTRWRELVAKEIVRPILAETALLIGDDSEQTAEAIASAEVSGAIALSPDEIGQIVGAAMVARDSELVAAETIADFLARELGENRDEVLRRIQKSGDILGRLDT